MSDLCIVCVTKLYLQSQNLDQHHFVPGAIFNRVVEFAVTLFAARFKQCNSVMIAPISYYEPDLVTSLD